jgi:murein DD-endopeptidase MepM/ murein hydrolase activator NlpD
MYFFSNILNYIRRKTRGVEAQRGIIPIVAAHDGVLSAGFNDNYKEGIYMKIRSTDDKAYETLYFHLSKLRVWRDDERMTGWERRNGRNYVKAGAIIGWGGNSGRYTTGPHLHFELRKNNKSIDPMPLFKDNIIYQRYRGMSGSDWFYKGIKRTRKYINSLNA